MNASAERAPCAAFAREQPETNVRVFHSDLRTDKDADLPSSAGPSGVRPAALALGNASRRQAPRHRIRRTVLSRRVRRLRRPSVDQLVSQRRAE